MARNGSGAMSIQNTLVSGATITAAAHNQNYSDIGTELTNSLALDGQSVMTGQFKAANGTVGAPGIAFGSDLDTGFYRIGSGNIGLALDGALVVNYSSTGIAITGTLSSTGAGTIGGTLTVTGAITATGGFAGTVSTTGSSAGFVAYEGISTEAGAGAGPIMNLHRNSASPAVNDAIGQLEFNGQDSAGNKTRYAYITSLITDPTNGSEDANILLVAVIGGAETTVLSSSGAQIAVPGSLAVTGAITGSNIKAMTKQYLTSGSSATYTAPSSPAPTRLVIKMVGGGGGGGASGGTGGTGGTTIFNSINANGGSGGGTGTTFGAGGGAGGSGGSGSASLRLGGGGGSGGMAISGSASQVGSGGNSAFGGGAQASNGAAGSTNTGGGGAGGASGSVVAGGGGAGEYVEIVISSPSATYTYTVGAVGSGASGGVAGGAGGSGLIIVEEYY